MTFLRLVLNNVTHYRRSAAATAACVAVMVAVLTGALTVGDSVRGSLRRLALDRLGPFDELLVTEQPFRAALADELAAQPGFHDYFAAAAPVFILRGTAQSQAADTARRVAQVTVLGCDASFWTFGGHPGFAPPQLKRDEVALNAALARRLAASVDDRVLLRIGRGGPLPADSPLGQKQRSETVASQELRVAAIIPNRGLGGFSLSPTQQETPCAFVNLATIQRMLDQPNRVNALLLAGRFDVDSAAWRSASMAGSAWLETHLHPKLEDYGLKLKRIVIGNPKNPASEYFQLTSQRMLLPPDVVRAAEAAWQGQAVQPVLTYLANALEYDGRQIPYSTITAVDSAPRIGPLLHEDGTPLKLTDDQIVLVDWAAEDLRAKPGAAIQVAYFEPETTHGEPRERIAQLNLRAIVSLAEAGSPPRMTNDPDLTPELKGVTDSESIEKWRVPFALTRTIRPRDDLYWTDHRTTPKAYVSLATGQKLWHSRFGQLTSLRVAPATGVTVELLTRQLVAEIQPARLGMEFRPVRRETLAAAVGATPLDALFLMFSFFLIAAVLMLLAALFRLGVDERAGEIGVLLATGFRRSQITRLLLLEGVLAAIPGALAGLGMGLGYAGLILAGLRGGWLSSVAAPRLELHWTFRGLLIGAAAGLLVAGVTIFLAVWRVGRMPVRRLLAGVTAPETDLSKSLPHRIRGTRLFGMSLLLALCALVALGSSAARAEAQAAYFFVSGALALTAGLWMARIWLSPTGRLASRQRLSLLWLAARNARLSPGRSLLCIGLVACVTFLLIATSVFRLEVSDAGSGGFNLLAESSLPILHDLGTPQGRAELGIADEDARPLSGSRVVPIRVHDGDDASCLNLYRPGQPRMLGVPPAMSQASGPFQWTDSGSGGSPTQWTSRKFALLDQPWQAGSARPIPVMLDENTARYSLGLAGQIGDTYTVQSATGQDVALQVVGLLRNSIFQGDLLLSESNLLKLFPDTRGDRYFLIRTPPGQQQAVMNVLEDRLGDFGFDITLTRQRLAALLAVQNTYLSTFQSLGALGLLLGTLGLAAVQLRGVQQRRGELALLRAAGFNRRRITALVLSEITALMLVGLTLGLGAALLAVWPQFRSGTALLPWIALAGMLLAVVGCGLAAGAIAARAALRMPLLAALKSG